MGEGGAPAPDGGPDLAKVGAIAKTVLERLERFRAARTQLQALHAEFDAKRAELLSALDGKAQPVREELSRLSPFGADLVHAPPTKRAAYSDRMAALMAKFALLAYVEFETPDGESLLKALLEAAGFDLVRVYAKDSTQAFLALNSDMAIVAFRGTTNETGWKTNMRVGVRRARIDGHPKAVRMHEGFLRALQGIEVDLRVDLQSDRAGRLPIYFTGHSLGGALALAAGAALGAAQSGSHLEALGDRAAAVYTFGAPRVGGHDFAECVKVPHYRIVNSGDIVPWTPPSWLFGYRHNGDLRLLRNKARLPSSVQSPTSLVARGFWALIVYGTGLNALFGVRPRSLADHDMALYSARLDAIASARSGWR